MKVLVIGYGISGKAASGLLRKQGHVVTVADRKAQEGVLSDQENIPLLGFDQVVLSPGIPQTHPLVQKALCLGIEVIGEIELGFRNLSNPCFGVTGSNGKTTTVTLIEHILNRSGFRARALGNVGSSLCSYLLNPVPQEILIIELSSFQLETLRTKKLDAAVVLNITPNHLDRHRNMQEYASAKANIQHCLKPEGKVYISDQVFHAFGHLFSSPHRFSKSENNFKAIAEKELAEINKLDYTHWLAPPEQSLQAAYLLCKQCGVTEVDFFYALKTYKKLPHRIEWVAEIDGVSYYNDSKSSNIHSVLHAVEQMKEGRLVLIIGGVHKGSSYEAWVQPFRGKVHQLIAYGKAAPIMAQELSPHFPLIQVNRFADAVKIAKQIAKKTELVLLSPGCSSYDQFENYEQRGDEFKRLVREQ